MEICDDVWIFNKFIFKFDILSYSVMVKIDEYNSAQCLVIREGIYIKFIWMKGFQRPNIYSTK